MSSNEIKKYAPYVLIPVCCLVLIYGVWGYFSGPSNDAVLVVETKTPSTVEPIVDHREEEYLQQIAELEEKVESLQHELTDAGKAVAVVQKAVKERDTLIHELKKELSYLDEQLYLQEKQIAKMEEEKRALAERKAPENSDELYERYEMLQELVESYKERLAYAEEHLSEVEEGCEMLAAQNQTLSKQLAEKESNWKDEKEKILAKDGFIEQFKKAIEEQKASLQDVQKTCIELTSEYDLVKPKQRKRQVAQTLEKQNQFHMVKKGETLSDISRQHYGTISGWQKIFDANRETIPDSNQLKVGTVLIIPEKK